MKELQDIHKMNRRTNLISGLAIVISLAVIVFQLVSLYSRLR